MADLEVRPTKNAPPLPTSRFTNLDSTHRPPGVWDVLRWSVIHRITRRRRVQPPGPPATRVEPDLTLIQRSDGSPRITWIGHSSALISMAGGQLLIDPVFAPRIGMFYKRHVPPGLTPEQLPAISAVLVSHNHYDHLDEQSISALPRHVTVVVPTNLGVWFRRRGFDKVVELAWWESTRVGEVEVFAVPARHWSRRGPFDANRSHWCGFVLRANAASIYHAGDTAWFDGFGDIGARFPNLDVAMLPIGGYEPTWFMDRNHMNPEQAGEAFGQLGASTMIPIHWGTFQMTDEPLCEPAERLRAWWSEHRQSESHGERAILDVGQTFELNAIATA